MTKWFASADGEHPSWQTQLPSNLFKRGTRWSSGKTEAIRNRRRKAESIGSLSWGSRRLKNPQPIIQIRGLGVPRSSCSALRLLQTVENFHTATMTLKNAAFGAHRNALANDPIGGGFHQDLLGCLERLGSADGTSEISELSAGKRQRDVVLLRLP